MSPGWQVVRPQRTKFRSVYVNGYPSDKNNGRVTSGTAMDYDAVGNPVGNGRYIEKAQIGYLYYIVRNGTGSYRRRRAAGVYLVSNV